jgi:hypothetical protein
MIERVLEPTRQLPRSAPLLRIAFERLKHDRVQLARHVGRELRGGAHRSRLHARRGLGVGRSAKQTSRREDLPGDDPHREDVQHRRRHARRQVLGRHVTRLASERAAVRLVRGHDGARRPLGDSEVGEPRRPVDPHEDVRRGHITMDDPHSRLARVRERMHRAEPVRRIEQDSPRDAGRERPVCQKPRKRCPLDVVHDE